MDGDVFHAPYTFCAKPAKAPAEPKFMIGMAGQESRSPENV
jgi:hypothetical protein